MTKTTPSASISRRWSSVEDQGRTEPAAQPVTRPRRDVRGPGERTGEGDVRLRQEHPAGGEVDRVGAAAVDRVRLTRGLVRVLADQVPSRPPGPLFRGLLQALLQSEPESAPGQSRALGAEQFGEHAAEELGRVLLEALDGGLRGPLRMGGGGDQAGERHADVLHVRGRVGDVVGVQRVQPADEVDQAGRALEGTAHDMRQLGVDGQIAVLETVADPVQGRGLGGSVGQGPP